MRPCPRVPCRAGGESKAKGVRGGVDYDPLREYESCVLALLRSSQDPVNLDIPENRRSRHPRFRGAETGPIPSRACPHAVVYLSELKLECQLDRARSADLIERVETTISAAGAQTVRQGLRRAPEQGAGQDVGGIAEVWVVQDVEELGPETKPHLLGDVK